MLYEMTKGRIINISAIKTIKRTGRIGREEGVVTFLDGKEETISGQDVDMLLALSSTTIQACPGFTVVVFWYRDDVDPDTFNILSDLRREPVVAWRLGLHDLEHSPITPGGSEHFSGSYGAAFCGVLWPDGAVQIPDRFLFDDLNRWIIEARKEWKAWISKRSHKLSLEQTLLVEPQSLPH